MRWIEERSRYFWLSLLVGVIAALAALPSFTDPWPGDLGGTVFVTVVVAALVRGVIELGRAFLDGWREPPHPTAG